MEQRVDDDAPVSRAQGYTLKTSRRFQRERIVPIIESSARNSAVGSAIETENEAFISIGIDLGTTYSGIAWALSTSPKDIDIISSWDSEFPASSDLHKVPSVLAYNSKGEVTSWGYKIEEHRHHISWFKLRLSEYGTQKLAEYQPLRAQRLEVLLTTFEKQPVDVVSDYLRCLWTHATETIKSKIGHTLWENLAIRIVLTVPAIWDHQAQELTRKSAEMAGLMVRGNTTLELIGEPEAAALAVFDDMKLQKERRLKVGDAFVVCDAGGGTVVSDIPHSLLILDNVDAADEYLQDLISYTVEQVDPLKLFMCSESTGGLCGAIFLDGAFEKQIRTMISAEDFALLSSRSKRKMMSDWEYGIKRGFRIDAAEHRKWFVDIPGYRGTQVLEPEASEEALALPGGFSSPRPLSQLRISSPFLSSEDLRIDPGSIMLKTGHLRAIFSEVCDKIKALVSEQLIVVTEREKKQPIAILLVGGFGESFYLKQDLERSFGDVEVQQPTKAWAAICRGAVLKGLGKEVVVNHITKYHYGISYNPSFKEGKHQDSDKYIDEVENIPRARNQMAWFLNKGDSVVKKNAVKQSFFFGLDREQKIEECTIQIFYSESVKPEQRVEGGVKQLCKLKLAFKPETYANLPKHVNNNGVAWRKLDIELDMRVSSGELLWAVTHNGLDAGTVTTDVGYE